jgi:outer membrane protein assembly factor BamB
MQHHPWLRLPSCFCLILVLLCPCLASALSGCAPPCEASAPSSGESDLLATGGLIYMEAPSAGILYLYALRANTGAVQWKFPAAGIASLAVDAGIVYLNIDGIFYGLRASDGHILWHHAITYPDLAYEGDAALYIYQYQSGTLIALNGSDGTHRWSARIPALITIDTKERIPEYGYEHMQSIDGVLYLVSYQGVTRALREDSGTLLWQTSAAAAPLPSSNLFGAAPLSQSHGLLYVFTNQLYTLRASDGKLVWQASPLTFQNFAVDSDRSIVYFVHETMLEALRASDGKLLWQMQHTFGPDLELLHGVLYNGRLHLPRQPDFDGLVYALSASDGRVLWHYQTNLVEDSLLSLMPSGLLDLLFQRDPNSKLLVALQAKDGKVLWQHSTQAANVILAGGSLYASYSGHAGTSCYAARDSQLEKFQSDTGTRLWRFQLAA